MLCYINVIIFQTKTAPVVISAFEEGIQFKHGSKVLHSPIIEAFGVTMEASVFEQLIKGLSLEYSV